MGYSLIVGIHLLLLVITFLLDSGLVFYFTFIFILSSQCDKVPSQQLPYLTSSSLLLEI